MDEFAVVFAALFAGHSFGDHWVQTGYQASCKGGRGEDRWEARRACTAHVATLQATKLALLVGAWLVLDLNLSIGAVALAFLVDGLTHYWADRRFTLEGLANRVGKGVFYDQGTDLVNHEGKHAPHVGTGKYVLDQSWHHLWLFVSAVIAVSF